MITYPPVIINEYLADKVPKRLPGQFRGSMKFFPTRPTSLNTLIKGNPGQGNDVYIVYDRMFRLRRRSFPHVKSEQLIYYLYKVNGDPESLIETVQVIYDLLDREDESGQEVNSWISSKVNSQGLLSFGSGRGAKIFKPVFFHEIRVFQLEEARYIVDHDSTQSFSAMKLMINYDYHVRDYL
jgi:hypothetical protein